MRLVSRSRLAAALVLGIVGVSTVATASVFPTPAYAAATPGDFTGVGAGGDVNYLPSAQGFTGADANARLNAQAQAAYAAMKTQYQQEAVDDFVRKNGVRTGVPLDLSKVDVPAEVKGLKTTSILGRGMAAMGPVGDTIGAYFIGTTITNQGAKLFGLDPSGYVCESTGDDAIGTLVRIVDGTTSCPDQPFATTYVPNADIAPQHEPGWVTYPLPWGCNGNVADASCYGIYTVSPQPKAVSGSQTFRIANQVANKAQYGQWLTGWCRTPSGDVNSIAMTADGPRNYDSKDSSIGLVQNFTLTCTAPQVLYAMQFTYTSSLSGDPDRYYSNDTRTWFSPLSPNASPAGPKPNPQRVVQCITLGSNNVKYSGPPNAYTDTDAALPVPSCADLPAGVTPKKVTVTRSTEGGKQDEVLNDFPVAPEVQDWLDRFPACSMYSLCNLSLQKKSGSSWTTCRDTSTACDGWFDADDKSTAYRCVYGVPGDQQPVDLSECDVYQSRYSAEAQQSGDTIADPATGKPLPNPTPQNNPQSDAGAMNSPVDSGDKRKGCFPSGFGALNPLAWIRAGQCVMNWAFVPRMSAIKKSTTGMEKAWEDTAPAKMTETVKDWDFEPQMTGCGGIETPADMLYKGQPAGHIMDACSGPLSTAATTIRVALNIIFGVGAAWSIASYLGSTIGYKGPSE